MLGEPNWLLMLLPRRGVRGELGVARAFSARVEVEGGRARRGGRVVVVEVEGVEVAILAVPHFEGVFGRLVWVYFIVFVRIKYIYSQCQT